MQEFYKMINEQNHFPIDKTLTQMRDKAHKIFKQFNQESNSQKREILLSSILGKMGEQCYITPDFFCDYGCNLELGSRVYFNANCMILDSAKVIIGDNTLIGPNCQFYTPTHPVDYKTRNTLVELAKPISVGKNCWLGGSVVVLSGVTIGDGCVIGAGAVVTKDIPKNSVAVGNPAKVIRIINQE